MWFDRWLEANDSLALLVPSVIVPEERSVLLNPLHPAFGELPTADVTPLHFDDRLLS
jgi:RES domain-containing protein